MTPEQKKHAAKAEKLELQAARNIDGAKQGFSEAGAVKTAKANEERQKAGLIKGKLVK